MSNPDRDPDEIDVEPEDRLVGPAVEVLTPREVPLGGPRAMTVRRTLPQRERSLIGAWCFADHYGPDDVAQTGGMSVAPHPHTGLATVSWLFTGEVEHRDSLGTHALVRPGELNLMTAGQGVSHSEISTSRTTVLHGAQLWVALPEDARDGPAAFAHHVPAPVGGEGWSASVFLGSLLGVTSPVETATPLLGAEVTLEPGVRLDLDVDPDFEHGVLVDTGAVEVAGRSVAAHELAYVAPGARTLALHALGDDPVRVLVLGGPPFGEPIVMWWNFVGRTHDEIVAARDAWQAQLGDGRQVAGRFGVVSELPPIPAPALPRVRLRTRG